MRSGLILLLVLGAVGCGRCSEKITNSNVALRFEPQSLTLGPTYVGVPVEETVVLKNDSAAQLDVRLALEGPFTMDVEQVRLSPGGAANITVRFAAEAPGTVLGKLLAVDFDAELDIAGIAEDVPSCGAPAACRTSRFDTAGRACVETMVADGSACAVGSACHASASCVAGACVPQLKQCPAGADPCQAPTCDSEVGCTFRVLADDTACGSADCAGAHLCRAGACTLDTSIKPSSCGTHPGTLAERIMLSGTPYGLATDSSSTAYVSLATANAVARIDVTMPATHVTPDLPVGNVPTGVAVDATRVFVTNQYSNSLSVIDRATFTTGQPVSLGMSPFIPALKGGFVYVSGAGADVVKVDLSNLAIAGTVTGTWSHANGVAFHPTLGTMFVAARDTGDVTEVDLSTFTAGRKLMPGSSPQAIVISNDGKELYVAREGGPLVIYDTATGMELAQVMMATGGFGLALTPDGAELLMTRASNGDVLRIDRVQRTVVGNLNTGGSPRRVGFAANGSVAVITNQSGWVDLVR